MTTRAAIGAKTDKTPHHTLQRSSSKLWNSMTLLVWAAPLARSCIFQDFSAGWGAGFWWVLEVGE
eukprot:6276572-Amphidinium_carterae.1